MSLLEREISLPMAFNVALLLLNMCITFVSVNMIQCFSVPKLNHFS